MNFAPLHNHSEYSALDGLSTPLEIAERCKVIGCECCGLSDHGTVAGHLEFAKVMQAAELKPIFACELYHGEKTEFAGQERDQNHFLAGALTDEGLRNLWRMVDAASQNFRFVGRVNYDICERFSEGVFATSACIQGRIAQEYLNEGDPFEPLNRYLEIYKDNFYIELHTYPGEEHEVLNSFLVDTARERGVGLVYATDAHYAGPEQYEAHNAYMRLKNMEHPKSLYMQDEAQIRESLSYLPEEAVTEALENTGIIAGQVNAQLPEVRRHLPVFIPAECPWLKDTGAVTGELFIDLVQQGLYERYGDDPSDEVWDRAEREMEVFLDAGLEHYFLQTWDFCQFCDKEGIRRGPGRGSAAGAIVSYALGITDVDPLHYGLIFERFYNPGREKGFPDIDNDFPTKQRKRVADYLASRWGQDRVRAIGTATRMKPKAALDKTYKAYDITWEEKEGVKKIIDTVPDLDILGVDSIGWRRGLDPGKSIYVEEHVGGQLIEWMQKQKEDRIDPLLDWIELVALVCGRISNYGIHPSGTVVSDVPLPDQLPSMWSASKKTQVTCFPMTDVDRLQFLKQDLLGLRNLDTLEDWESQIGEKNWTNLDRMEHPDEMWEMLDQGLTLGIFQIEDGYARRLCKEFKPRSVEDLAVIVALNRPGPIRSGAPDSFIARRKGDEQVVYDHPMLEDILEETYGWFLYQEQVIAYFNALGYELSDSDAVRKILGKKKPEQMEALREGQGEWDGKGYYEMATKHMPRESAEIIWNKLEGFAAYSFNKSHAVCYAVMALRTLYAKYTATPNNVLACLRTNPEEAGKYVAEARRMDIGVLPPDIDLSEADATIADDDSIVFGFANIKGIGVGSGRYLVSLRNQYELSSPEILYAAIEREQETWEAERDEAKENGDPFKKKSPRQLFRQNLIPLLEAAGAWDRINPRDVTITERQKQERELLGVVISDQSAQIFERHAEYIDDKCCDYDLLDDDDVAWVKLPGIVTKVDEKKTKKDKKTMGIVTIEYGGSEAEFVVFPQDWKGHRSLWKERTAGVFELKKTDRGVHFNSGTKLSI